MSRIALFARRPLRRVAAPAAALAFMALTATAFGAHWPMFGGDAGRSGHQPVDAGTLPVSKRYHVSAPEDRNIRTSVVATNGGTEAASSIAYGTANGFAHVQRLTDGAPRGTQAGARIDNGNADADLFTGAGGSVTPLDTGTGSGDGMLLFLHNDDNQEGADSLGNGDPDPRSGGDIALAIVDPATGDVVFDRTIGGRDPAGEETINMTISSSPVVGPVLPGSPPVREVFFLAARAEDAVDPVEQETLCDPNFNFDEEGLIGQGCNVPEEQRLFKLTITNPATRDAGVAVVQSIAVPGANTDSSPTLVRLSEPGTSPPVARTYVAVAHTETDESIGVIRTYETSDFGAGPVSQTLGSRVWTPSQAVRSDGHTADPDAPIYVAAETGTDTFKVYELRQGTAQPVRLVVSDAARDQSGTMSGDPAPALAVGATSDGPPSGARVVVTADRNMYSLDANNLAVGTAFDPSSSLAPGTTGFSNTTPALQGGLAYVQRDNGEQLVLDQVTLNRAAGFVPWEDPTGAQANDGIGQPAISRGYVVFGHADGAFAYRNESAPTVAITAPEPGGTLSGDATVEATAYNVRSGISKVTFFLSGIAIGDGTLVSGSPTSATNPGVYRLTFDATRFGNGQYVLTATATDADSGADAPSESATSAGRPVTVANGIPTQLSVGDVEIAEGDAGTRAATFTVTKAGPGGGSVKVTTRDGTATAGQDYDAIDTTVTFAPGDTAKQVTVPVRGDTTDEPDETFTVVLSNPTGGASLADASGLGTIRDDDPTPQGPGPQDPVLSISSATLGEGSRGDRRRMSFDVSLSRPVANSVTVSYATADETAKAGEDYVAKSGTVTLPAGDLSRTITVNLRGDNRIEGDEIFVVVLSNPRGAGLGTARGSGVIVDDELRAGAKRQTPTLVTLSVKPRRDRKAPYRFRSTGNLITPAKVAPAVGCSGRVSVQVKAGKKTISTRRVRLRQNCTYASRVTFKSRKRFTRGGRLKFTARFLGNGLLTAKKSKSVFARTR